MIIGLGYLVGNIRIAGFQLGVVSVLFAGIFLGALDHRLGLPEYIYVIGLVLFVYAIGLQSGPGFFGSFRMRGLRDQCCCSPDPCRGRPPGRRARERSWAARTDDCRAILRRAH